MRASLAFCLASLAATASAQPTHDSPMAVHSANYSDSVLYVEARGYLYNGDTERLSGTGFFITPEGHVVTVNHIIPSKRIFKNVEIWGYIGKKEPSRRIDLRVIDIDEARDVALLKADFPPGRSAIPLARPHQVAMGSWVGILAFELEDELSIADGHIRSLQHKRGFWKCDVAINPGSSGAPIFDLQGRVVAIAWGSERFVVQVIDGVERTIPLQGMNYVLPYEDSVGDLLKKNNVVHATYSPPRGPVAAAMAMPSPGRARAAAPGPFAMLGAMPRPSPPPATPAKPPTLGVPERSKPNEYSFTVQQAIASPREEIVRILKPRDGYRFETMTATITPNKGAGPGTVAARTVNYLPDGSAEFRIALECAECSGNFLGQMLGATQAQFDFEAKVDVVEVPLPKSLRKLAALKRSFDVSHVPENETQMLALPWSWKNYQRRLTAEPGYRFSEAKFKETAKSNTRSVEVTILEGGREALLTYSLPKGGWLFGSVSTRQVSEEKAP